MNFKCKSILVKKRTMKDPGLSFFLVGTCLYLFYNPNRLIKPYKGTAGTHNPNGCLYIDKGELTEIIANLE